MIDQIADNEDSELEILGLFVGLLLVVILYTFALIRKFKKYFTFKSKDGFLTKHILHKKGKVIVLRGMRHVAPKALYDRIQAELNLAHERGSMIFAEGVRRPILQELQTISIKEHRIIRMFRLLIGLYPVFAEVGGEVTQKKNIAYPIGTINADTTMLEVARRISQNGFNAGWVLKLVEYASAFQDGSIVKEEVKEELQEVCQKTTKKKSNVVGRLIMFLLFRKIIDVILFWRNEVAVITLLECLEKEEEGMGRKVAYMHYGQAHIPGIIELLEDEGWEAKLVEETPI